MTKTNVDEYAAQARSALGTAISAARQGFQSADAPERMVLVDGSALSPSWRAMAGGASAWDYANRLLDDGYPASAGEVLQSMSEVCDELDSEFGTYWEDGCMFLDNPYAFTVTIMVDLVADDEDHAAQRANAMAASLEEFDGVRSSSAEVSEG